MPAHKHAFLVDLTAHITKQTIPNYWYEKIARIKKDAAHLDDLLDVSNPPTIYGVNTLVGHLDHVNLTDEEMSEFQQYLIHNHMLGAGESYSDFEVNCISYMKMHTFSLGGSGITPQLYKHLLTLMEERKVTPHVPKHASYSSGDVIPGAHWANGVTRLLREDFSYPLKRKEGLSLINGSFVHVGVSVAKLMDTQSVFALYNHNSLTYMDLLKSKRSNFSEELTTDKDDSLMNPLKWAAEKMEYEVEHHIQDPVSIRSYPQVSSAFLNSLTAFMDAIEEQLQRRSDNPLVVHEEVEALSQASFMAPMISLATGQLIESMLLVMWQVERRLHFLLSGGVEGIPLNGSTADDALGFIQVPKLVSAILEESRLKAGRRTFASGSSTSYGIEDMWTNGLTTLDTLETITENLNQMLAIELAVILNIEKRFFNHEEQFERFEKYKAIEVFREQYQAINADNQLLALPIPYDLKPFEQIG